jgi:DNA-directed RNA polymerase subunit RPC12/RpoP
MFMFNSRCPNCNYSLVLLERRAKYKCALCSKLFPQKEVDDKEFQKME